MSLSDRLRAEACSIRPTVDDGLAARVTAAVRAARGGPPLVFPASRRVWPWLAAAASVAVLAGLVWVNANPPAPAQTPPVVAVAPPSVPIPAVLVPAPRDTLSGLLASIPAGGPLASELDALGADLTAAARTVRGVVPF